MDARDEFYTVLADDLTLYGKKSVLYEYLDQEQEQGALQGEKKELGKARSYQLRIRYYRRQLKAGNISPEEYLKQLLETLAKKPQFGKPCGKQKRSLESNRIIGYSSQNPQPLLEKMADIAVGHEDTGEKKTTDQKIKAACALLFQEESPEYKKAMRRLGENGFWTPPYRRLMAITDAVLDVAVAYDMKEFFFGTVVEKKDSYTVRKRQKPADGGSGGSRAERTDKSLKLMDFYCRKRGKALFGLRAGESRAPGDMDCDALYWKLLKEKNENVFVPLLIDPVTGCGIYILGKAYFEGEYADDQEKYKRLKESCAYSVLRFDDDYGADIKTGFHMCSKFGEFPNYNSARFDGVWSYENVRQDMEKTIKELNAKMPAGAPEIFRKYFEDDTDPEAEMYARETLQAVAACEKELEERDKLWGNI